MEEKVRRAEVQLKERCRMGPFPLIEDDEIEEEDIDLYEKGNRLFATVIWATGNFSQQLVEAHLKNSTPKEPSNAIPPHFRQFADMFTKESFDTLPERKQWDHTIELVPDTKLSNCKVYPMSVAE